ncbi:MAG: hypothetical protein K2N08_05940 [Muribaculaceae bacterium]|nr:hypothetical protein [Muribaculaceae bacterium]MDE5844761.1 hypothetical protein [Muribaculaceae bacterium]MDE7369299.1 hypothetical protein [Muribaculaceae bacterium]
MGQSKTASRVWILVMTVGMLLIVAGTVLPIWRLDNNIYKYVYTVGAVMLLVSRLFNPYKGTDIRLKRLVRIESWSAIFFCVAAFFMFYDSTTARDWLAFTLAGGVIQVYTSIMIPRVEAKNRKQRQN